MEAPWQRLRNGGWVWQKGLARRHLIFPALVCALLFSRVLTPVGPSLAGSAPGPVLDETDTTAAAVIPSDWKTLFTDSFEGGNTDRWEMHSQAGSAGVWKIESEGANHFFSGTGFSWVTLAAENGRWADFRFKTRVRLMQGTVLLNYRFSRDPYYFVSFRSTGVQLSRTPLDTLLANADGEYSSAKWYQIEIIGIGTNIKVYVDGNLKINYTDTVNVASGTVGFEAPGNSHVHVDDVEISGPAPLGGLSWVKTGGPIGGLGYDVRMRADNPDMMFVTDTWSGVNMSVDGGRTWSASNKGISTRTGPSGDAIPIFCLTVDPHNPDIVWAGAQNVRGLFKSMDGGKTWISKVRGIVEETGIAFRGITVDPRNSNLIYAAAEISSVRWAGKEILGKEFDLTKGVVYRSPDGGENWSAIWRGDNLARYVWIDPRDSNVIYVSTGIFDREAANSAVLSGVPGGVGILKSTDGGLTWRALTEANGLASLYIGSLFMHPRNPDVLLAGAGFNGGLEQIAGVYRSTDGGEHWQRGVAAGTQQVIAGLITSVEFATSDPQIAYAANDTIFYRSTDGGHGWAAMSGGPPLHFYGPPGIRVGFPIDLQVDPRNPNRVFINNYGGGNFVTEDGGRTWQTASKGYTGAQLHKVAVGADDPRRVVTIGRSGVFSSDDGGQNWQGLNTHPGLGGAMGTMAVDPAEPERLLASDEFEGTLLLSLDGGQHWELVFRHPAVQPSGWLGRHGFRSLVFAPSNHRVVYGGFSQDRRHTDGGSVGPSFGVYRSVDGGRTWVEDNDSNSAGQNVNVLAVHPRNADVVYAGTIKGGVLRSEDGGRSWRPVNQGLPLRDVRTLAIDTGNPSIIFAGLENGGVYKTIDGGSGWKSAGSGMDPQAAIRDIVIDPAHANVIYASDLRTGVYRSDDGGGLWLQLNGGLSTRAVKSLAISPDGGTLYAATEGEGVFRLDIKARVTSVSAASFVSGGAVAPESIASGFGEGLAATTASATALPLPTTLAGVSVSVTDSSGVERLAPLFFVSAGQINYLVPAGTAPGVAKVQVQGHVGYVTIETVSPGLFTANSSGSGVPAAVAVRGSEVLPLFQCGTAVGSCVTAPIDLGAENDEVFLLLFGTGIRGGANTTVKIGGVDAPVAYAGAQGTLVGLDQVNVKLPRELIGRGEVDLALTVDGKAANVVRVRIKTQTLVFSRQ